MTLLINIVSQLEQQSGITFKAGFNLKKTLFGKIVIYNILYTSLFSLSKFSFVITILIMQFYSVIFTLFSVYIHLFATSVSFVKGSNLMSKIISSYIFSQGMF